MSGPHLNSGKQVQEYVYSFADDGGAISTIALSSKANVDPLPLGAVVTEVVLKVITAFTSGGSATLSWGNSDGVTTYSGTAVPVASLVANACFNGMGNGASVLWNDTEDAAVPFPVINAADAAVNVSIAAAAMTAGKAVIMVEYFHHAASA